MQPYTLELSSMMVGGIILNTYIHNYPQPNPSFAPLKPQYTLNVPITRYCPVKNINFSHAQASSPK